MYSHITWAQGNQTLDDGIVHRFFRSGRGLSCGNMLLNMYILQS